MGKVNVKLMQGIEETEGQIMKEKQASADDDSDTGKNAEVLEKSAVKAGDNQESLQESKAEAAKVKEQPKKRAAYVNAAKAANSSKKMPQKQVFSFRAEACDINVWKAFAVASGKKMESVGTEAMNMYMKRYSLTEAETAVFNALMAKNVDK